MHDKHLDTLPQLEPVPQESAMAERGTSPGPRGHFGSGKTGTVRRFGCWWGCQDCMQQMKEGGVGIWWLHLRKCLTCGHIGCCDSSPFRHARAHSHASDHPIVQSFEPGEDWRYCFVDDQIVKES